MNKRTRIAIVLLSLFSALMVGAVQGQTLGTPPNITDTYAASNQIGFCIDSGGSGSCTANDFLITSIDIQNVDDGCSSPDDYMQIDALISFNKATPQRYDITAWFYRGDDQAVLPNPDFVAQNARDGDFCTRISLETGLDITREVAPFDIVGTSQLLANDADSCADVPNTPNGNLVQLVNDLVLPCRDIGVPDPSDPQGAPLSATPDGIIDISGCTSWDNNAGTLCDGPEYDGVGEPVAGTGAKCNCGEFSGLTLQVGQPDISVTKTCTPEQLLPGAATTCTIQIINSGVGEQIGASAAGQEGFFYEDDYPEQFGLMPDAISNVVTSQGTTEDGVVLNSNGTPSSNRSLNIYPGNIPGGTTVTVTYDFTTDPNLPVTSQDITNTVCASYFDVGEDGTVEVFSYAFDEDLCASATVTTPVSLTEFSIERSSGVHHFSWGTETETNNLGFNIYGRLGNTLFKLNQELIPSNVISSLEPSNYAVSIPDDKNGQIQAFYLEDIDLRGNPTKHGPFKVNQGNSSERDVAVASARPKTDWQNISVLNAESAKKRKETKRKNSLDRAKRSAETGFGIQINRSGVHRLSIEELVQRGADQKALQQGVFTLTGPDQSPVSVRLVRGSGKTSGFIEFIATVERTFYSDISVYQLHVGVGDAARVSTANKVGINGKRGSGSPVSAYYLHSETVKTDQIYVNSSRVERDPWMLNQLFAINRPATRVVSVPISDFAQGANTAARVEAQMVGGIDLPDALDRRYELSIGGQSIAARETDGLDVVLLAGDVDEIVDADELTVSLTSTPVNAANIDVSYTNQVSVVYPRKYVAIEDRLSFTSADQNFSIAGLQSDSASVYYQNGTATVFLGDFPVQGGTVTFTGPGETANYVVTGQASVLQPEVTIADDGISLTDGAEHLVISHPNFIGPALQDYVQARSDFAAGNSMIVSTDQIYAQYSGGVRDAEAIHEFIVAYAAQNGLASVLLIGGDVYDYHDNLGLGAVSFVPTLYRATDDIIQFSPVDALFGDIDFDGFPDVSVGRLPVRTADELEKILSKMEMFARQQGRVSALLAADELRESNPYNFIEASEQVATVLEQQNWEVSRAYIDVLGVAGARSSLLQNLNAGPRLALYSGHSSASTWSAKRLFSYADALSLSNDSSPSAYLQWGCYNTYFSSPYADSLSHGLMLSGGQGAAVVVGSSTLTNAYAEEDFAVLMQAALLHGGGQSMGAAMIEAKQQFARRVGLRQKDILWGVTLLGDPLLSL